MSTASSSGAGWTFSSDRPPPLVQVCRPDGKPVGLGVVLEIPGWPPSPGWFGPLILTCAHVVAYALGLRADHEEMPDAIVPVRALDDDTSPARVKPVFWERLQGESGDMAFLAPSEKPLDRWEVATPNTTSDLLGKRVQACGFPRDAGGKLRWASGTLSLPLPGGWVQINDEATSGYPIQPGYSGTGLFDEGGCVVGIVVAADPDVQLKVSAAIPLHMVSQKVSEFINWPSQTERAPREEEIYKQLRRLELERHQLRRKAAGLGQFSAPSDAVRLRALDGKIRKLRAELER